MKKKHNQNDQKSSEGFSDRLNIACDAALIPPKNRGRQMRLAEIGNVTQGASRKWLEEDSIPRTPVLRRLCDALNVREEWLVSGQGEMRSTPKLDINQDMLTEVMIAVDAIAAEKGFTFTPAMRARAISAFYQQAIAAGHVDKDIIRTMLSVMSSL